MCSAKPAAGGSHRKEEKSEKGSLEGEGQKSRRHSSVTGGCPAVVQRGRQRKKWDRNMEDKIAKKIQSRNEPLKIARRKTVALKNQNKEKGPEGTQLGVCKSHRNIL